jgi:hypothetical protein
MLFLAVLLSGCETVGDPLSPGSAPFAITGPAASAVAGDMASRLAEQIGSTNKTAIKMRNDTTEYAAALSAALKGWGYTVITDEPVGKDQKPVELSYSVSSVDGQVLARLETASVALGRAYTATTTGATPVSPLSIMRRD